ncbi:MAG: twin-arginine translocation signal domain-containing protein, partial [Luminiphilus sp.]|nr:twin-arginine translocation signal domain-containing protein [Luminiphilus sp.]
MRNPKFLPRNRRQFLLGSGAAALGLTLPSCDSPPAERYSQADIELLARQRALEEQTRGRGPYGPHVYQGYRGLAQLPWFDLDANGALRCTDEEVP